MSASAPLEKGRTCGHCGADWRKTGFTLQSVMSETFVLMGDSLRKVGDSQGYPNVAYCLVCDHALIVDVQKLLGSL